MQDEGSCGPRWMVLKLGGFGNSSRPFQSFNTLVRNIHVAYRLSRYGTDGREHLSV